MAYTTSTENTNYITVENKAGDLICFVNPAKGVDMEDLVSFLKSKKLRATIKSKEDRKISLD